MLGLDKAGLDRLLIQLEDGGFLDPKYKFCKGKRELKLLGSGGFSYVYEMYETQAPEKRYAAKVIGADGKGIEENLILETTQIQYFLGEQSENILKAAALWMMKVRLDEDGNPAEVIGFNEEGYSEARGLALQIVLTEKLDNIFLKDKYGNVMLLRDDLKTEEGVVRFAEHVGRALLAVHNNGFLHRDVKLENIFWDENLRQYKLGDFGISKYVGDGDAETVAFTDGYGAPEIERQLTDSYNETADIYSFGITLFLLLNDLRFPASDGYRVNIVQYSRDFIVPAPEGASEDMARIIRKMCSYRAEERYQSIEEVLMEIARTGGGDTQQDFAEYEDLPTETYRESARRESRKEEKEAEVRETEEIPWWEKSEEELSREERKRKNRIYEQIYTEGTVYGMCISAILFAMLNIAFSPDASYVVSWQFWILPAALLVEAILQRTREFHVAFGVITVALACLSLYSSGMNMPQMVIIGSVLLGIPAITAGCAIGTGLWIVWMLTGKLAWLSFLYRWDLGWIVIIGIVVVLENQVFLRVEYNRTTQLRFYVWTWIIDKIWCILIISGILLFLLEHFWGMAIPEMCRRMHLIRIGIGILIVELIYLNLYGLWEDDDKEAGETNESVDE